jgi:hypothetical protein
MKLWILAVLASAARQRCLNKLMSSDEKWNQVGEWISTNKLIMLGSSRNILTCCALVLFSRFGVCIEKEYIFGRPFIICDAAGAGQHANIV